MGRVREGEGMKKKKKAGELIFPSKIIGLIPMKRKLIVKMEDGQVRYIDKKNFKIITR